MIETEKQDVEYWALFFTAGPEDPLRRQLGHYEFGLFCPDRYVKEYGVTAQELAQIAAAVSDLERQRG